MKAQRPDPPEEAILTPEVDASPAHQGKRMFDVVGRCGRPDLSDLKIRGHDVPLEIQDGVEVEGLLDTIWIVPPQTT
jgi:hypothetical protein